MRKSMFSLVVVLATVFALAGLASAGDGGVGKGRMAQVGPRPFYLLNDMEDSALKAELQQCGDGPFYATDFSIGHRGACLQFPEHTKESYEAAARMGAGICECDVTFTKDKELVCRHSQCDLATTTNILAIPELAAKCSKPFTPAEFDANGKLIKKASAMCCTSDITLEEFKSLKGKMDASNSAATTVEAFMDATPSFRTDLYSARGTLMTHAESIELFKKLGVKMTPELKSASVKMPFDGNYTQEAYAQQMIDEYKKAGVDPKSVFAQSFNLDDVLYWLDKEPEFGKQAVYLDDRDEKFKDFSPADSKTWKPGMKALFDKGVRIIAPPIWMLLQADANGKYAPSLYAKEAKAAGLDIITWSMERSGPLNTGGGWYYQTVNDITNNDGDMLEVLDVLAQDVGIIGIFADWPGTVTWYANCKGLIK